MQMRVLHGLQPNISICICHQFSIEWNYKFWIVRYCVRYSHKLVGHEDYDYIYRVTEYMRFGSGSVHGPHGSFHIKKTARRTWVGWRRIACAVVQLCSDRAKTINMKLLFIRQFLSVGEHKTKFVGRAELCLYLMCGTHWHHSNYFLSFGWSWLLLAMYTPLVCWFNNSNFVCKTIRHATQ